MDTYSYISENGVVRQIEDLIAKAKNEEQDTDIAANRTAINTLSASVEQKLKQKATALGTVFIDAANETELLSKIGKYTKENQYAKKPGEAVLFGGGWSGKQYGMFLVQRVDGVRYVIYYLGQSKLLQGAYNVNTETLESAYQAACTPL